MNPSDINDKDVFCENQDHFKAQKGSQGVSEMVFGKRFEPNEFFEVGDFWSIDRPISAKRLMQDSCKRSGEKDEEEKKEE